MDNEDQNILLGRQIAQQRAHAIVQQRHAQAAARIMAGRRDMHRLAPIRGHRCSHVQGGNDGPCVMRNEMDILAANPAYALMPPGPPRAALAPDLYVCQYGGTHVCTESTCTARYLIDNMGGVCPLTGRTYAMINRGGMWSKETEGRWLEGRRSGDASRTNALVEGQQRVHSVYDAQRRASPAQSGSKKEEEEGGPRREPALAAIDAAFGPSALRPTRPREPALATPQSSKAEACQKAPATTASLGRQQAH